jgi:hypothetical protein
MPCPQNVAVAYLRELPLTWRKAAGGVGRQLTADALFDRIEVLGLQEATVHLTEHAVRHGLGTALPEEFGISVIGRGERASAALTQRSIRFLMINRTARSRVAVERSA